MMIFFATFSLFLVVFLIMAVGYIIQRKRIHGSCGGLDAIGIEKECDCPEPECRRSVTARITQRHYGSAPGVTYEVEDTSTNCSGSECNAKTATVRFSCGGESHTQRVTLTCGGYTSSTEFFSSSCDADSITVSASY